MKIFSSLREEDIKNIELLRDELLRLVKDDDFKSVLKMAKTFKKVDSLNFKIRNSLEDQDKIEKYKKDFKKENDILEGLKKSLGDDISRLVFRFTLMTMVMNIKGLLKEANFFYWLVCGGSQFDYYSVRG